MDAYEFMKKAGELTSHNQKCYHDFAKEYGVNYNTLGVFYTCYVNKSCTQKQITVEWYIPKQTVNTICKELVADGYLIKTQSPYDHRETILTLTDKGVDKAAPMVEHLLKIEKGIIDAMGEENAARFLDIYTAYSEIFETEFSTKAGE